MDPTVKFQLHFNSGSAARENQTWRDQDVALVLSRTGSNLSILENFLAISGAPMFQCGSFFIHRVLVESKQKNQGEKATSETQLIMATQWLSFLNLPQTPAGPRCSRSQDVPPELRNSCMMGFRPQGRSARTSWGTWCVKKKNTKKFHPPKKQAMGCYLLRFWKLTLGTGSLTAS